MRPRGKDMRRLLEQVAADLGDGHTEARSEEQRDLFVSMVTDEDFAARPRRGMVLATAAAATAAAAAVLVIIFWPADEQLRFWIGEERVTGTVGDWLQASENRMTTVGFDQGSRVVLERRAAARIVAADETAVSIDLSRGGLDADIVGNRKTRWTVAAGPFRVTVLGTRFTVAWDDDTRVIDVKVTRGVVLVQGRGLSEHGIKVTSGRHLRADGRTGFVSLNAVDSKRYDPKEPSLLALPPRRSSAVEPAPEAVSRVSQNPMGPPPPVVTEGRAAGPSGPPTSAVSTVESTPAPRPSPDAPSPESTAVAATAPPAPIFKSIEPIVPPTLPAGDPPSGAVPDEADSEDVEAAEEDPNREWLALYAKEKFSKALREAEALGIPKLSRELGAADLWKLQDTARSAERPDIATSVLTAYRDRFPGTGRSRIAGFLLGRIASDQEGDLRAAARWFDGYLTEDPDGPLAEEALGRLMIVYTKIGRSSEAEKAARRYLKKYENGSFEAVARSIAKSR